MDTINGIYANAAINRAVERHQIVARFANVRLNDVRDLSQAEATAKMPEKTRVIQACRRAGDLLEAGGNIYFLRWDAETDCYAVPCYRLDDVFEQDGQPATNQNGRVVSLEYYS